MMTQLRCADKYEAQKIAGLLLTADHETYVTKILNIIENEVVIMVKDSSAHSILFASSFEVERFADFVQSVLEKKHSITSAKVAGDCVHVSKQ